MTGLYTTRLRATRVLEQLASAEAKADADLDVMLEGARGVRRNMDRLARRHGAAIEGGTLKPDEQRDAEDAYMEACRGRARCDNVAGIGEQLRLGGRGR